MVKFKLSVFVAESKDPVVAPEEVVILTVTPLPAVPSTADPSLAVILNAAPLSSVSVPLASTKAVVEFARITLPVDSAPGAYDSAKLILPAASAPTVESLKSNVVLAFAAALAAGTVAVTKAFVAAEVIFTLMATLPAAPKLAESI